MKVITIKDKTNSFKKFAKRSLSIFMIASCITVGSFSTPSKAEAISFRDLATIAGAAGIAATGPDKQNKGERAARAAAGALAGQVLADIVDQVQYSRQNRVYRQPQPVYRQPQPVYNPAPVYAPQPAYPQTAPTEVYEEKETQDIVYGPNGEITSKRVHQEKAVKGRRPVRY